MLEKILITGRVNHRKVFVVGKYDDSNKSGIIIRWLSKVKLWFNQVDIGYVGTQNKLKLQKRDQSYDFLIRIFNKKWQCLGLSKFSDNH